MSARSAVIAHLTARLCPLSNGLYVLLDLIFAELYNLFLQMTQFAAGDLASGILLNGEGALSPDKIKLGTVHWATLLYL